ncbi:MAG TPA: hypothetical protein DCO79_11595 [Spirochaeta sp.]|nr:hypothetical protein [Spirochaeta sp.]
MKKSIIIFAVLILTAGSIYAQTLKAYVMQSEPLGYIENGQPKGEHVDYLQAIADKAGIDIDIEVVPKSKVFAGIKSGDIDVSIFFRASKWDNFVEYAGKVRDIRIVAVNRVGKPLNSYTDLYNSSRVGVLANTSISDEFDNDSSINRFSVPNYETMLKTIAGGRIDTGVGNAIVLSYLTNKLGFSSKIQSEGITLGSNAQWLQFSKKADNLDQLDKFSAALEALKADGTLDSILDGYAGSSWRDLNAID